MNPRVEKKSIEFNNVYNNLYNQLKKSSSGKEVPFKDILDLANDIINDIDFKISVISKSENNLIIRRTYQNPCTIKGHSHPDAKQVMYIIKGKAINWSKNNGQILVPQEKQSDNEKTKFDSKYGLGYVFEPGEEHNITILEPNTITVNKYEKVDQ
jgi:hypothetical protein